MAALAIATTPAAADARSNSCVTPLGDDLNQTFDTTDAFVAPFCATLAPGTRWRPIAFLTAAEHDGVFPDGCRPSSDDGAADFLAKLVTVRYTVDAGTPRARTYAFDRSELMVQRGELPDGNLFVRWAPPPLPPLPPGRHVVDEYMTLNTEFWDGIGVDSSSNRIPAGESVAGSIAFDVDVAR